MLYIFQLVFTVLIKVYRYKVFTNKEDEKYY